MTPAQLSSLLVEILTLPHETEWVEWKHRGSVGELRTVLGLNRI